MVMDFTVMGVRLAVNHFLSLFTQESKTVEEHESTGKCLLDEVF
jgi:hypothetical protein